jgi:hypothetical protein
MARFGRDDVQLGKPRLVRRAVSKISIDRLDELRLVPSHQPMQAPETITPRREIGIAIGSERVTLGAEYALEPLRDRVLDGLHRCVHLDCCAR